MNDETMHAAPSEAKPAPDAAIEDVHDVGWNEKSESIEPLLEGAPSNDQLWLLLRRFDKEVFCVKQSTKPRDAGLDCYLSHDAPFSADKLRTQYERFYMSVLLKLLTGLKHLSRLRSWLEPRRTGTFCIVYFTTWYFNILITVIILALMGLILIPRLRTLLFPPVPVALVDYKSGGLSKPAAGVLGSTDSATGAPETFKGEAVEKEAETFATNIAGIAVNVWTKEDEEEAAQPYRSGSSSVQPNDARAIIAIAKDKAKGVQDPTQDKTKHSMQTAMWSAVTPYLWTVHAVSDVWERLANALDPIPPFPKNRQRLQLIRMLMPFLLLSVFATPALVVRASTLIAGLALFGKPVLVRLHHWLGRRSPGWSERMPIDHGLLKGIPNNNQLAIALLRHAEKQNAPLPPPPSLDQHSPVQAEPISAKHDADAWDETLGATSEEIEEAAAPDADALNEAGGPDSEVKETDSRKPHRLFKLAKGTINTAVRTALRVDKVRAKVGSTSAQNRLGVIPKRDSVDQGPSTFTARCGGNEGQLRISNGIVSFDEDWTVQIRDITALKKHSGLGLKTKYVVGWALEQNIKDGLEINDREGRVLMLTAVSQRDQVFARLCAIGEQAWDVW